MFPACRGGGTYLGVIAMRQEGVALISSAQHKPVGQRDRERSRLKCSGNS